MNRRDNDIILRRNVRFNVKSIWINSNLEIVWIVAEHTQLVEQGFRVLSPKNDTIHKIRRQIDSTNLMYTHRVTCINISLRETVR